MLDQRVEAVTCRWCGTGASVEVIDEAGEARAAVPAVTPDLPGARFAVAYNGLTCGSITWCRYPSRSRQSATTAG